MSNNNDSIDTEHGASKRMKVIYQRRPSTKSQDSFIGKFVKDHPMSLVKGACPICTQQIIDIKRMKEVEVVRKLEHLMLGRQSNMYDKLMREVRQRVVLHERESEGNLTRISD